MKLKTVVRITKYFLFLFVIFFTIMERIGIETAQNVSINYRVASVGDRIGASMLDNLILAAYWIIASWVISETMPPYDSDSDTIWFLAMLPHALYHLLSEIFLGGQSLGKKAVKIKVTRIDGAQASIGNYLIRWLFRIVDIVLFLGLVAMVVIAVNGKGQRLGDIVAKTTVISLRRKQDIQTTIYQEVPENYAMVYSDVHLLAENDIRTIKEVLANYKQNPISALASDYVFRTADAVEKKIGAQRKQSPAEFLNTILKDYNYYFKYEVN